MKVVTTGRRMPMFYKPSGISLSAIPKPVLNNLEY